MSTAKPKSVLIGFSTCPLCGGKTHVKRIDAEGKRPYSHCLDEHDKGCSHTHYATNAQQQALMLAKMRPIAGASATPSPAPAAIQPEAELESTAPTPSLSLAMQKPAAPVRRGLFG